MQRVPTRPAVLAGLPIERVLPYRRRRCVGPFLFLDHIGPHRLDNGVGLDVGPHPHIGLATLTYLYEGAILHRDGLGMRQLLRPGDVNWMVAGSGLAHAERSPPHARGCADTLHAVQAWMYLDDDAREAPPSFCHVPAAKVADLACGPVRLRLLAGSWGGIDAVVRARPSAFYAELRALRAGRVHLAHPGAEAGLYVATGEVRCNGASVRAPNLLCFDVDEEVDVEFVGAATGVWFGGAPLATPPTLWWNFAAPNAARIAEAARAWAAGEFAQVVDEPLEANVPLPAGDAPPIF